MTPALDSLCADLARAPILEERQRAEVRRLRRRCASVEDMLRELVRRGWLTSFQAEQIREGGVDALLLGPSVLLERLGEGGMGAVFKARHTLMDRVVAVKVLRAAAPAPGEPALKRFHREIRALARLSHPNVIVAHDAGLVGEAPYLVMEYVPGIDLARMVRERGKLPSGEACEFIRQTTLALQHVHVCGLVHRDVKPSNLLVVSGETGCAQVKLLDLGLARFQEPSGREGTELTADGAVMGTLDYLAPEQAAESHTADIRADLYSLGCTLYHLLAGRPPFPGGSALDKLIRHREQEPDPLRRSCPDCPPEVAAIVRKLMAKSPEDRFQTPAEVAAALAPWASLLPATAVTLPPRPAPASERSTEAYHSRPPRRRRIWLAAGAAVGLLGVLALVAVWRFRPAATPPGTPPDAPPAEEPKAPWQGRAGELYRHAGEAGPVGHWDLSRTGRTLVFHKGNAVVLDLPGQREVRSFPNANWGYLSPDGRKAFLGQDFAVRLMDVDSGDELFDFDRTSPILFVGGFSADGRRFATADSENKGTLIIWDLEKRKPVQHLRGKAAPVAVAFCLGDTRVLVASADTMLGLWDVSTGKEVQRVKAEVLAGPSGGPVLSPDRKFFLAGPDLSVYRIEPWKRRRRFQGNVTAARFSPDGQRVASTSVGWARVWEIAGASGRSSTTAWRSANVCKSAPRPTPACSPASTRWAAAGSIRPGSARRCGTFTSTRPLTAWKPGARRG
jgi:serine/threonine-protein kinase